MAVNSLADYNLCIQKVGLLESKHIITAVSTNRAYLQNAIKWAKANGQNASLVKYFLLSFESGAGQFYEVIRLGNEIIDDKTFQKNKLALEMLSGMQYAYFFVEDYKGLMALYPKYLEINKLHGITKDKTDFFKDKYTGVTNYKQNNIVKAILEFKKEALVNLNYKHYVYLSGSYNNLGLCFARLNMWDTALYYYDLALATLKNNRANIKDKPLPYADYFELVILSNKADYFVLQKQYDKALPFYLKEAYESHRIGEMNITISAYFNLAKLFQGKKNYKQSILYADSCIQIAPGYGEMNAKIKALNLNGRNYAFLQNAEAANFCFNEEKRLSDSLINEKNKQAYSQSTIQFEVARTESELKLSQQKIESEKAANRLQLIGLLMLGIAVVILGFFYRKVQKDKAIISQQNKAAQLAINEKDILLKEVHHRVKNNLQVISSLLDLQASKLQEPKYTAIMNDAQRYIHSMSMVHQMLYQNENFVHINFQEYLSSLAASIASGQINKKVKINVKAPNVLLSIDKSIPLALITTELITNSYKHGFGTNQGEINIQIENIIANQYNFTYKDNGKGLPANFEIQNIKSLGFRLLRMLVEEMGSTLKILPYTGIYLAFEFTEKKNTNA